MFLLSGFLICHAVGWYIEKFDGGYLRERSWFQVIQKIFRVFQNPHVIYATTRVNSFTIFLLSLFYCRQNFCQVNRQFFRRTSWQVYLLYSEYHSYILCSYIFAIRIELLYIRTNEVRENINSVYITCKNNIEQSRGVRRHIFFRIQ